MSLFVLFRLYKNLPEVKAKNEEKKRLAFYRTNRLRAQLYDKVGSRLFYYGFRFFSYIRHPSLRQKIEKKRGLFKSLQSFRRSMRNHILQAFGCLSQRTRLFKNTLSRVKIHCVDLPHLTRMNKRAMFPGCVALRRLYN